MTIKEITDMTAQELIDQLGTTLLGRKVNTEAMGEYPGSVADVIELHPDPTAPEIVFTIKHPTFGEIGVFDFEECSLA